MSDRTTIAYFLSLNDLGVFAFATGFVMFGINFLADYGRVLQPILWEDSARANDARESFSNATRMAIYMGVVVGMLIPVAQVIFTLVVRVFLPKYMGSVLVFLILSHVLYLASAAIIPNLILYSVVVNKQIHGTVIYGCGAIMNIVCDVVSIYMGWGIIGVSYVTVGSHVVLTVSLYMLARPHMTKYADEYLSMLVHIGLPFVVCVMFSILNAFLMSKHLNPWLCGFISVTCQFIVWTSVLTVTYRKYFPKEKLLSMVSEVWQFVLPSLTKRIGPAVVANINRRRRNP